MNFRPALFISYRRSQSQRVRLVAQALKDAGVDCFFDLIDIGPLADFPETIRAGIDRSHAMLLWWSKDYGESRICLEEFRYGWQHARRHSSDVGLRIWVVNPEEAAQHIFAGEINSKSFLSVPSVGDEARWCEPLLDRLNQLLPDGRLADERHSQPDAILYNVPVRSLQFTARDRELMSIHSKLHPAHIGCTGSAVMVQTHGMAGVGKTELVAVYARDFAAAYPGGIFWLNFAGWHPTNPAREDEAQWAWIRALEEALGPNTEICRKLTRDIGDKALSPAATRERLAAWLRENTAYLWILDNVPEISPLDVRNRTLDFIRAPTRLGRTLMTTRDARPANEFAQEDLDVLSEEDALRLLDRFRPDHAHREMESMRKLVREVGAHTQALVLLGEHARHFPGGYPRVLDRLIETGRLKRIEQIAEQLQGLLGAHSRGIVATFSLSIEGLSAGAKELLSLASVCAANRPIPEDLLLAGFGGQAREDGFTASSSELLRASLLSHRQGSASNLFIHPLAADATLHILKADTLGLRRTMADALLARMADAKGISAESVEDMEQAREIGPLLLELSGVLLLCRVGTLELARGRYAEAVATFTRRVELGRRVLGIDHPETLIGMSNLACALLPQGDLTGARKLLEDVVPIQRRILGEEHRATLSAQNNLANVLFAQGHLTEARASLEDVLATMRRILGEEHPDALMAMHNLAKTLRLQGDIGGALALQKRVVSSRQRTSGKEHPDTLLALNALAAILHDQGEFDTAKTLTEQIIQIRSRVLGEEHPDTLTSQHNLATTLIKLKDFGNALALLDRVVLCRRRTQGDQHPDTLGSLGSVAIAYASLGDFGKAREIQERLLSARRHSLGEKHLLTLVSMVNLADTLNAQLDFDAARALSGRALRICYRALGREHYVTTSSAWALLWSLHGLGEDAAECAVLANDLLWLISYDPATLSPGQRAIRTFLIRDFCGSL